MVDTRHSSLRSLVLRGGAVAVGLSVLSVLAATSGQAGQVGQRSAPLGQATAYAVIGTLATSSQPAHIAILNSHDANISDDTVFVGVASDVVAFRPGATTGSVGSGLGVNSAVASLTTSDNGVYVGLNSALQVKRYPTSASGPTAALATAALPTSPTALAVGGAGTPTTGDDSVYVGYYNNWSFIDSYSFDLASRVDAAITLSNPQPWGIVVGGSHSSSTSDDTVYVTGNGYGSGTLVQFRPDLSGQVGLRPGYSLLTTTVHDDSLVIGPVSRDMRAIRVTNWDDSVAMGANGGFIASSRQGIVGSMDAYTPTASFLPVGSATVDDTIALNLAGSFNRDIAFAGDGVAYLTYSSTTVALVDKVTAATPASASGAVGSSLQISLTLQSSRVMDDSTVSEVWFGSTQVPVTRVAGQNAVTVTVPDGSGDVALTVALRGGNAMNAGTFTVRAEPVNPPAPTPADPPLDVVAVSGDASADVSWSASLSSGSFPMTDYLVRSSPGGRTCLTSVLSCTVTGLANGTAYTFTVQALTGAGWSAASDPSNAVTPSARSGPSVVITGSRDGGRIQVSGTATGFGMGGELVPWVRLAGQGAYSAGPTTILVSMDGTFEWSRRSAKRASVYVATPAGDVRSNTVVVRGR